MNTHTPGPWIAIKGVEEADDDRCGVAADRGQLQWLIATIENGAPGDFCDTEFANARLISAAPDLLEACESLLEYAVRVSGDPEPEIPRLRAARAAIAKARGQ